MPSRHDCHSEDPVPAAPAVGAAGRPGGEPVAIGIGANLGDAAAAIDRAVAGLAHGGLEGLCRAGLYRTRPVGCTADTPAFLNTAVTGRWRGSPRLLLALCRRLEVSLGRPAYRQADHCRSIDLDLLLVGQRCLDDAVLTLPHPRLTERLFVLEPLAEIAPDWVVPPTGRSVASWRDQARRADGAAGWGERLTPP